MGFYYSHEIVSKPDMADKIEDSYCILCDQSIRGITFETMDKAINSMAKRGWRCINITYGRGVTAALIREAVYMYALMERK